MRRHTRVSKLKQVLKENNLKNDYIDEEEDQQDPEKKKNKKKRELKFPWWFKIFAYMLSFAFVTVSLFFVIVKGIEFGDEKVQKWLTSLIISFFTSLLLTQPLQVINFILFFYFLSRLFKLLNALDRFSYLLFGNFIQKRR